MLKVVNHSSSSFSQNFNTKSILINNDSRYRKLIHDISGYKHNSKTVRDTGIHDHSSRIQSKTFR